MELKKINLLWVLLSATVYPHNLPPPGLENCKNSCYMNSALQLLLSIDYLIKNFKSVDQVKNPLYKSEIPLPALFVELVKAYYANNSSKTSHMPTDDKIITCDQHLGAMRDIYVAEKKFDQCSQQDTVEFIATLIGQLVSEANINEESDLAHMIVTLNKSLFYIRIIEVLTCYDDKGLPEHKSKMQEINFIPVLPITIYEHTNSLTECLDAYFTPGDVDTYTYNNKTYVNNCKRGPLLSEIPHYLFIHLKRFHDVNQKITKPIAIPTTNSLDLKGYCSRAMTNTKYNLIGVAIHSGGTGGGHYIAYVRRHQGWYYCNDTTIIFKGSQLDADSINEIAVGGYLFLCQRADTEKGNPAIEEKPQKKEHPTKEAPGKELQPSSQPLIDALQKYGTALENLTKILQA